MSSHLNIVGVQKAYSKVLILYPTIRVSERITVFYGQNGSGKSTLLLAIMGWIHYEGTIEHNETISYMHSTPYYPKDLTLKEYLDTLVEPYDNWLTTFRLQDKLHQSIHSLSNGMKTKLNIIQCLIKPATMYLLDEPFQGLDQTAINELITYMHQSEQKFIIATHNKDVIDQLKGEVILID